MIWHDSICAPSKGSPSCVQRSSTAYSSEPQRTTSTASPSMSAANDPESPTESALPMSTQSQLMKTSKHPGLQARGLGHHALVPGRIEGQLHARGIHRWDALNLVF